MPEKPRISIITVNLDDVEGLKRTMTSVFEQTYQEFEYVIIDGGSNDGSKEYIETHKDKLDYWVSEPDTGIYNAMNKGIRAANGKYLLFLNSGDELYSSTVLEKNVHFVHTDDFIYFDICQMFSSKTQIHQYPIILNFKTFIHGSIGHPTTFIKESLFQKIGYYDEDLQIVSDWKFFIIAIVKFNCSWRKVNAVLSKFYMDGISSNNNALVIEERRNVLELNFSDNLKLIELENFKKNVKSSKTIRFLQKLGLLKFIDKTN